MNIPESDLPEILNPFDNGPDAKWLQSSVNFAKAVHDIDGAKEQLDSILDHLCPAYCLTGRNATFYNELKRRIEELWA